MKMQKYKTVRAIEPNAGARMSLRNKLIKLNKDFSEFVLFSMMQELDKAQYLSDYYVRDGSFFKIDNITLGYNFPELFKAKERALGLNLYFTVQNVCTFTKYDGLDPEVYGGIDNNIYPRPRTFTLGAKLNF